MEQFIECFTLNLTYLTWIRNLFGLNAQDSWMMVPFNGITKVFFSKKIYFSSNRSLRLFFWSLSSIKRGSFIKKLWWKFIAFCFDFGMHWKQGWSIFSLMMKLARMQLSLSITIGLERLHLIPKKLFLFPFPLPFRVTDLHKNVLKFLQKINLNIQGHSG